MGTTADKLTYLQSTKETIKQAIISKGVAVPYGATFRDYAGFIGEIIGGEYTVDVSHINSFTMEQKQYVFPLAANDTELDRVFLAALTFTVNSRDYGIFYIPGAYGQNIDGLGNIYGNSTPDSRVLYAADGSVVYWFIDSSSLSVDLSAAQNITIIRVVTV